ncbi:hypothetical protein CVS40_12436 [Lucilia cuprina]|nr:hypothetical protein CVS40_12436 [Lucilia cuprina]
MVGVKKGAEYYGYECKKKDAAAVYVGGCYNCLLLHLLLFSIPSSHGATDSFSFADFKIVSGKGNECLTIAPYKPYSAIIVLRPQHFSVLRHLARRF